MYEVKLAGEQADAVSWYRGRYSWADLDAYHWDTLDDGSVLYRLEEHEAWKWRDAVDEEDQGGSLAGLFPCAGRELRGALYSLYESIV